MKNPAEQVFTYGATVWSNLEMDELRKRECLCLNCKRREYCEYAAIMYNVCILGDIALMVTRCKLYEASYID
jgi:hypothetical protein